MSAKDIWSMLKQTVSDFFEDKAQTLAAALAVFAMISLAPLLVIVTKVVGVRYSDAPQKVSQTLTGVLPGMTETQIQEIIKRAGTHGEGVFATTVAAVIAVFGATGVFGQLQDSMNTIWEVKPKPNQGVWGFIRTRFLSFAMVLGIAFLLMVSTVGTTLVTTLGEWVVGKDNKVVASLLSHGMSLVIMWVLFTLIFKVLPDAKTAWKDCLIGAAVTAVLFEVGKVALAFYLEGSSTKVFGAAGSLAALLLFIFYSAQIMFLGAEFTQVYAARYGAGVVPSENAVKVTEEDKAQEGRPSPQRLEAKAAQKEGRRAGAAASAVAGAGSRMGVPYAGTRPPAYAAGQVHAAQGASAQPKDFIVAAGGLAAGALGAWYLSTQSRRPTPKLAAAVHLDERVDRIEQKIGRIARLKEMIGDVRTYERIRDVERQIRHARTAVRAEDAHRPRWAVRLGDLIAGNR